MRFEVEIVRGEKTLQLLGTDAFRERLTDLYARCPWSTVFQSLPFLDAWYRSYDASYEPLLVTGVDEGKNLVGLLPLAVEKASGALVVAGANQAEYQTWLALSELRAEFVEAALESLREAFPRGQLQLAFIRPDTPLESFRAGGAWNGSSDLRSAPRPLMALGDGSKLRESLKKKSNKSRLNRLEKLGTLQIQHIERFEEMEAELDEIFAFNDIRKGAVFGKLPFRKDPRKRLFHVLQLKAPRLLHVSVLRLDGKVISAHIGARDRDQVLLGILTHSPFLAEHSVGKLHLLLLGILLAEEGFREFDLTPGGAYKDRFATHHDEVFVLTIFFRRGDRLRYKAHRRMAGLARKALRRLSEEPGPAGNNNGGSPSATARLRALAGLRSSLFETRETRLYKIEISRFSDPGEPLAMRRDDLNELMSYQATDDGRASVQEFLSGALASLEAGHHAYTSVSNGVLVCAGWLAGPLAAVEIRDAGREWRVPGDGAAFYGFYVHPDHREEGLREGALVRMLRDAAAEGAAYAYALVPGSDRAACRWIEATGFRHEESFFRKSALDRALHRSARTRAE